MRHILAGFGAYVQQDKLSRPSHRAINSIPFQQTPVAKLWLYNGDMRTKKIQWPPTAFSTLFHFTFGEESKN